MFQLFFAVSRAVDEFACVWEDIIPEGEPDEVACTGTKDDGTNYFNFLDVTEGQTGLCLADVSINILRSCYQESSVICEPYRGVAGKDCYLDCARYHLNCCCGADSWIMVSPTPQPITPTNNPTRKPTKSPTVSPTLTKKPTTSPTRAPTASPLNPTAAPLSVAPVTPDPTVTPTTSSKPSPLLCPWAAYETARCTDLDVTLGDGDCKFNPGNFNAVCGATVLFKCNQMAIDHDFRCIQLCRDFHRECCCGIMKPGL